MRQKFVFNFLIDIKLSDFEGKHSVHHLGSVQNFGISNCSVLILKPQITFENVKIKAFSVINYLIISKTYMK